MAKYNAAREFGMKSLYANDTSKMFKEMNKTMTGSSGAPLLTKKTDTFSPTHISPNPQQSQAYKLAISTKTKGQMGQSGHHFNLGHGDPFYRSPINASLDNEPTLSEMQK